MPKQAAILGILWAAFFAQRAWAIPEHLLLDSAHARISIETYAFGMIPVNGRFTRFQGVLVIDPAQSGSCQISLSLDVASIEMPNAAIRSDILSPNLLDAGRFPTVTFSGNCVGPTIAGALTLHGEQHALAFDVDRQPPDIYQARAELDRAQWGVTGRPFLAGRRIRIKVTTRLPQP